MNDQKNKNRSLDPILLLVSQLLYNIVNNNILSQYLLPKLNI